MPAPMPQPPPTYRTPEHLRLEAARSGAVPWKAWGPYLSERQWGTVREDTATSGDAWDDFTHDQARSRTYRWGEDGIAGIWDDRQRLCLSLALWNGADPILKERMFGLTNGEGNHGEDVKEYWFYLDSTPTHSYLQLPVQVPPARLPVRRPGGHERGAAAREDMEYELLDTGVFDEDRYFDVDGRVRQGRPRRHPDAGHRAQPRARCGDAARAADALVPQHLVVGRRTPKPGAGGRHRRRRDPRRPSPSSGRGGSTPTPRRAAAVLRQRDQPRARCSATPTPRCISRTRSTSYVVARRERRGQPRASRHQGRRPPRVGGRRRRHRRGPARACG